MYKSTGRALCFSRQGGIDIEDYYMAMIRLVRTLFALVLTVYHLDSRAQFGAQSDRDNNCVKKLSGDQVDELSQIMSAFEFPDWANYPTSSVSLRNAIYTAYDGKDFYSGRSIAIEEMVIDHIIPKSKGGPDNFFNYVPTVAALNIRKSAYFDQASAVAILSLVRLVFANKVKVLLAKTSQASRIRRPKTMTLAELSRIQTGWISLEGFVIKAAHRRQAERNEKVFEYLTELIKTNIDRNVIDLRIDDLSIPNLRPWAVLEALKSLDGIIRIIGRVRFDDNETTAISDLFEVLQIKHNGQRLSALGLTYSANIKIQIWIHPILQRVLAENNNILEAGGNFYFGRDTIATKLFSHNP